MPKISQSIEQEFDTARSIAKANDSALKNPLAMENSPAKENTNIGEPLDVEKPLAEFKQISGLEEFDNELPIARAYDDKPGKEDSDSSTATIPNDVRKSSEFENETLEEDVEHNA